MHPCAPVVRLVIFSIKKTLSLYFRFTSWYSRRAGTPELWGHFFQQFLSKLVFYRILSSNSYGFWHKRRRYIIVIIIRDIKQIFKYFFIYFNLGDDKGEPHTLGELFLSLKSNGDTNPALFELCHTIMMK